LAGVAAAGAVAATVVLAGGGTASAASLSLNWTCPFPPLADQTLATNISVNLPASIPANTPTGAIAVTVAATVPSTATQGLDLVGGASLSGTASAAATLTEPGGQTLNLTIPMTIPTTPIPQDGSAFTTTATGNAPSIQFATTGQGTIVVGGTFTMSLHIVTSSGQPTSLPDPYNTTCTANSGQNMQLATFTVTPPPTSTSTTSTTPTTPTSPSCGTNPDRGYCTTTQTPPPTTTPTCGTNPDLGYCTPTTTPPTTTPPPSCGTQPDTGAFCTTTQTPPPTTSTSGGAPPSVTYGISGQTQVKALGATVPLGPGSLDVSISPSGVAGDLTLPTATANFNLYGFIPGTAQVKLTSASPTTINLSSTGVTADAKENIQLTSVSVVGMSLLSAGSTCQTSSPADIALSSGPGFTLLSGGTLSGTYAIPQLTGCGFFQSFINAFTAGPGNTISITATPKA
jgi:hypothetical protein